MNDEDKRKPARLRPPRPIKLQISLTEEERDELSRRAEAHGFESVAAYIRHVALR